MEDANEQVGGLLKVSKHLLLCVLTRFAVILTCAEPQRHLLRVQRLRSPQHPAHAAVGQAGVAQHRGGAEDASRPTF